MPNVHGGTPKDHGGTPENYERTPEGSRTPKGYVGTPEGYEGTPKGYATAVCRKRSSFCELFAKGFSKFSKRKTLKIRIARRRGAIFVW